MVIDASEEITSARRARALLMCGIVAGPLYLFLGALQILIRPGFDWRRHPLSLMSNGDLGWIQIGNFLITGALLVAAAVGLKESMRSGRGRTWAPRMLGLYGFGLIGAGIFSADPALGFPPGTPLTDTSISTLGVLHFVTGAFGFAGFVAACCILALRFKELGQPGWSIYSLVTGVVFLATFVGVASGSPGAVPYFYAGVTQGFIGLSLILSHVRAAVS